MAHRVGLVWADARRSVDVRTLETSRFGRLARALRRLGLEPVPIVWEEASSEAARGELLGIDAALVWVNPGTGGRDRIVLDGVLRECAGAGVLVSAHPDTIDAIGTKEVLYRTRHLPWGSDVHRYGSIAEFEAGFPSRLAGSAARVLKPSRGNGGNGVWMAALAGPTGTDGVDPSTAIRVRHAARGAVESTTTLAAFMGAQAQVIASGGVIIDQEYQERLAEGTIRAYLSGGRVVGFGEQRVNALHPAPDGSRPEDAPQPGPRHYFPADRSDLQALRTALETEWVPAMCAALDIDAASLPVIWDADFIHGPARGDGGPDHVLCEINASSVHPFPDSALGPIAMEVARRLSTR